MAEPGSDLQFDRAQFEGPAAAACTFCTRPLSGSYFEVNGKLACEACRYKAEEAWNGGSGMARFLKAAAYGSVAAAVGGGLYWGVREVTGYELSLISIAVGWVVGMGVRVGSAGRGGWLYQLLAVFLTYTSIVGTYAPYVLKGLREGVNKEAAKTPGETPVEEPKQAAAAEKPSGLGMLVAMVVLAVVVFISPFLLVFGSGGSGIIGLVIIGIGMWQAWSMNRKATLQIAGPFSLARPSPPAPAPDPAA